MKYKIIISCIFLGCYTLSTCAKPTLPSLYSMQYSPSLQAQKLNISLPSQAQNKTLNQGRQNIASDTTLILANAKKSPKINFMVLSTSKNAVLKAVLKKKSYGLRYTMIW